MLWQIQEAKQRLSELLRAATRNGPQIITRHGEEIAVVIDIAEYYRLRSDVPDFKDFLRSGPDFEELDLTRSRELPSETDWTDAESAASVSELRRRLDAEGPEGPPGRVPPPARLASQS